jgi:hypothetical protein
MERRAGSAALYSALSEGDGSFVQRSYLARVDHANLTATREGTVLQLLQTGLLEQNPLAFRPHSWDGYFQLVDGYQHELQTLGAYPPGPIQPASADYQHALLLASLNVERRNLDIRPPFAFTSDPAFTGNHRGDDGSYAPFKIGLPLLMGLLAFFAASRHGRAPSRAQRPVRRYRGFVVETVQPRVVALARQSAVLSHAALAVEPQLAPAGRCTGPVPADQPPAAGVLELLHGWARLGAYALRQALRDPIARDLRPIGVAMTSWLRRQKPSGSGLAGCEAAPV